MVLGFGTKTENNVYKENPVKLDNDFGATNMSKDSFDKGYCNGEKRNVKLDNPNQRMETSADSIEE